MSIVSRGTIREKRRQILIDIVSEWLYNYRYETYTRIDTLRKRALRAGTRALYDAERTHQKLPLRRGGGRRVRPQREQISHGRVLLFRPPLSLLARREAAPSRQRNDEELPRRALVRSGYHDRALQAARHQGGAGVQKRLFARLRYRLPRVRLAQQAHRALGR